MTEYIMQIVSVWCHRLSALLALDPDKFSILQKLVAFTPAVVT